MWCNSPPQFVRKLEGGITNSSIVVRDDQQHYVLRINAFNSKALGLNRGLEQTILQSASEAAISSALIYADPSERYLVCEYIHGRHIKTADIGNRVSIQQLAQLLKKIHQLPAVNDSLDIKRRIKTYWRSIDSDHPALSALLELRSQVEPHISQALSKNTDLCICHHDLLPENLIVTADGDLLAIDWEYAAMGDPYFDLAVVIDGLALNQQQTQTLMTTYFETETPTPQLTQHLNHWRVIYRYIALLWYGVQCNQQSDSIYHDAFLIYRRELQDFLISLQGDD